MKTSVECAVVKPESVYSASKTKTFLIGERTTVLVVCFPFLKGVDGFPFARYTADLNDLLKDGKGHGSFTDEVDRLT